MPFRPRYKWPFLCSIIKSSKTLHNSYDRIVCVDRRARESIEIRFFTVQYRWVADTLQTPSLSPSRDRP